MPPRAIWTGQLRLSLVSFGVRLYAATESATRVSMNQLHKGCNQRVRNQLVCPVHGSIDRDQIVKGYEYEKDKYVILAQEDLDAIKLPSGRTIDLVQFVGEGEIDPLYIDAPYYLGPDGPVAEEAFRVIREALREAGKVGIGKLSLHGREHAVMVRPSGKGFLLSTLRYASEVRGGDQFFSDVSDGAADREQLKLAQSIMQSKTAPFDPSAFGDRYQQAFFEIVKAKIQGEQPVLVEHEEAPSTFNFMDALRLSVEEAQRAAAGKPAAPAKAARKKPPAASVSRSRRKARGA
jgi:DNA end-binding protein Ku